MGVTVLVFAVELQKVHTDCISSNSWEDWGEFQNEIYVEGGTKYWTIFFYRIYINISQLGCNVIEMALKWNLKWFTTTLTSTMRVSVRKMNSATRVPLTLRTFLTHWVSSRPETTTIEKSNNISPADFSSTNFISWIMFLQTLFSRGPSCYTHWGMRSVIPARGMPGGGVHDYRSNWTMQ